MLPAFENMKPVCTQQTQHILCCHQHDESYTSHRLLNLTRNVASPGGRVWVARPKIYLSTLRVSADPWALKGPRGLVKCSQDHETHLILCMRDPLRRGILSHMNFPSGAAAFHGCRLTIPCGKQDAGPNELIMPEILMNNHPKIIYSFALIVPAIFPAQ